MAEKNRVLWSEGMFLRPQHFQQHDRYLESFVEGRCHSLRAYDWGFSKLKIEGSSLKTGQLALTECKGIFPDGTPFDLPEIDELPLQLDIPDDSQNTIVYLAVATRRPGSVEIGENASHNAVTRYYPESCEVRDYADGQSTNLNIGKLQTRLLAGGEDRAGYICLGVARILERRNDNSVVLDDSYIPPVLKCEVSNNLTGFIKRAEGLLHTQGDTMEATVSGASQGGVAEISDLLRLQVINRFEPLIRHFAGLPDLHPESFYQILIQLVGEMATFTPIKRLPVFPAYIHDELYSTFAPVMEELHTVFSKIPLSRAEPIPLTGPQHGIYGAKILEPNLLDSADFILGVKADINPEKIRSHFPKLVRIGPAEEIPQIIKDAVAGITVQSLPAVPRQIPVHTGFSYFELNKHNEYWKRLKNSRGFAFQIASGFPNLELEFWAIRSS